SSRVAFEVRWRELVDALLEEPALEHAILVMLAAGVRLDPLRAVAGVLDDNSDLLDRIVEPPPIPPLALGVWWDDLGAACAAAVDCRFADDNLCGRLSELAEYGQQLAAAPDDIERIRMLRAAKPSFRVNNTGRKTNWTDIDAVRSRVVRL